MKGLAEGASGGCLIELGPEEAEEGVAAHKFARWACRDAGEHGDSLRLCEEGPEIPAIGGRKLEGTEQPKAEHGRDEGRARAVTRQVTVGRRMGDKVRV